jgi:hypothetical protein
MHEATLVGDEDVSRAERGGLGRMRRQADEYQDCTAYPQPHQDHDSTPGVVHLNAILVEVE